MSALKDTLVKLTRQLFPRGRAFKFPEGGVADKFIKASAEQEEQAVLDIASIKNSIIPDNDGFDENDADNWERVFGISSSSLVPLATRGEAIKQKMKQPGDNPEKGNWEYLQEQLQNAGFNVSVFENRFPLYPSGHEAKNPVDVCGTTSILKEIQYGQIQYGQARYGGRFNNLCVQHIDEDRDNLFNVVGNFKNMVFIGGNPVGSFANVPLARKAEFRQLIIKSKHLHIVGSLFINYV